MRVRAIKIGYFHGLRIPGTESEEFEVPDGTTGSWFEPVRGPATAPIRPGKGKKDADEAAGGESAGDGLV